MKKAFLIFLFFLSFFTFAQGTPTIQLKDSSTLKLSSLHIKVNITGNSASTTYDMKFYNELDRTLEGELAFPLGQGQTVSEFALELNGELRSAVIVEKQLARVAFETTVRQNIDPALLEKIAGNNYKARVYPILPQQYKRVVLTYEEQLSSDEDHLVFELPLGIDQQIDDFSLEISVFGSASKPTLINSFYKDLVFTKNGTVETAAIVEKNIIPQKPIKVTMNNNAAEVNLMTYRDYFYSYIPIKPESINKKKPKKISILWDASYSMKNRDLDRELELLNQYFDYLNNVEVEFISFQNRILKKSSFRVQNGKWVALNKLMKNQTYDGGTNYESLKNIKIKSDEILLFSDGLTNLGHIPEFKKRPIYVVNSMVSADHFSLNKLATDSGGSYINLGKVSLQKASNQLKQATLQFLGIKKNGQVSEVYPTSRTNITGDFTIAGRFQENTTLVLEFGYRGKVTKTKVISIKSSDNSELVKRLWAKEKLKELNREKETNRSQIISLAKQYHLITDYTSMLILDRIEDYVRYRIEPPKELKAQYKELLKERDEEDAWAQKNIESRKKEIFETYRDILDWYRGSFPKKEKKPTIQTTTNTVSNTAPNRSNNNVARTNNRNVSRVAVDHSKRVISGKVSDKTDALPYATVVVKGTTRGTETDINGNFWINAEENEVLVFSFLGFKTVEKRVGNINTINIVLEEDGNTLDEVVIMGFMSSDQSNVRATTIERRLMGAAAGVQVFQASGYADKVVIRGNSSISSNETLYIVDGVPVTGNPLNSMNSNDIENMQAVNAASAVALYGSRARNGIVVITTKKGKEANKQAIETLNKQIEEKIELKPWNPDTPYISILQKEPNASAAYQKYLSIRNDYSNSPMFFIDVADFFDKKNSRELAVTVLTNLIEIDLDNYELIKALAYKLEYFQQYALAAKIYEKVLELRPEEPQSYRDLALAYELSGSYQKSFDLLYKIYSGKLLEKDPDRRFEGIESIVYVELTRLVSTYGRHLKLNKNQRKFFQKIPVDVRIVVDWNHNDTDIDLWVIEPNGEKAFYKNPNTKMGGRMSDDMTEGYGPEEFLLKDAVKGKYQIMIDYFADNVQKISGPTILKVTMFTNYGRKNEQRKTIIVKLDKEEDDLEVGSLIFD